MKNEFDPDIRKLIEERIPARFAHAKISEINKQIYDYLLQKRFTKPHCKGLFLYGKVGAGKTYTVCALAKQLLANDYDVRIFNLPGLLNIIRSSFKKENTYDEQHEQTTTAFVHDMKDIEKLINLEILIIDDIGKEKPSAWVAEILYYLINTRYEKMLTTIFTSNLKLSELAEKIEDSSLVSRIKESCEIYHINTNDKRIQ